MNDKIRTGRHGTPISVTQSLADAICQIEISKQAAAKAVNQLEFASHIIKHGMIEPRLAGPIKAAFMQKIGQVADLGVKAFAGIENAGWVDETCRKLSDDAGDGPVSGWQNSLPTLAGGKNPAAGSAEAERAATMEQAAYGSN